MDDRQQYNFVVDGLANLGAEADKVGIQPSTFFSTVAGILVSITLTNGGLQAVKNLTDSMFEYGEALNESMDQQQEESRDADSTSTIH